VLLAAAEVGGVVMCDRAKNEKVQDGMPAMELFRCWTRHCLCCCRFRLSGGAEEAGRY